MRIAPVFASVLASATLALAACSSTATGTGSSGTSGTSGGGRGLLGNLGNTSGGSSGTTSGGTSGTTSGSTSGTSPSSICQPQAGDLACDTCGRSQCCSQVQACFVNSAACQQLIACANTCAETDDACYQRCVNNNPAGQQVFNTLFTCLQNKCASPCGLTSTSGGGPDGVPPGGGG